MQTRLLVLALTFTAVLAGCGDDTVATSDPGSTPASSTPPTTPSATPSQVDQVDDIGPAFRAFARGGDVPPLGDEVSLYLGNAFTGLVTASDDREAWATCTETGSYAGYSCPLSPLEVLKHHRAVAYADRPHGLCMPTYGPLPPDLRKLDRVVIVPKPDSIEMCAQNFAIQLLTNDEGELVAVSTLLGEP